MQKYILLLLCPLVLTGCPGSKIIRENHRINSWVYDVMQEHYLWAGKLPEKNTTDVELGPFAYFRNVLVYKVPDDEYAGDRFSTLVSLVGEVDIQEGTSGESAAAGMERHFGILMQLSSEGDTYCTVLYVNPGSPADKAGIKRGECFQKINGTKITKTSDYYAQVNNESITIEFFYPEKRTVTIRKDYYYDNPILFDTIYDLAPRTGYVFYNHFTSGDNDEYFQQLKNIFIRFKEADVENIILDLRYNGGGDLSTARQLASLLAPADKLGSIYLYKERNSSYESRGDFEPEYLMNASEVGSYNCGNISLYILTRRVTASASELLIHCLRPLFGEGRFYHIGGKTVGKNVGGISVTNSRYEYQVNPITMRVHNINKESGYEAGLTPDITVSEQHVEEDIGDGFLIRKIGDIGDIETELMLRRTMDFIYGINGWDKSGNSIVPLEGLGTRSAASAAPGNEPLTNIPQRGLFEGRYYY